MTPKPGIALATHILLEDGAEARVHLSKTHRIELSVRGICDRNAGQHPGEGTSTQVCLWLRMKLAAWLVASRGLQAGLGESWPLTAASL